ncbi:MAG: lysylphosphatidylglycerol synthase transmembrane domain-containing protein [Acidobacteria bacterium]|nr:lysylphosphatidylglycerol synthase transmembrane domain-containing protein [Acidobacteriota bacterium]
MRQPGAWRALFTVALLVGLAWWFDLEDVVGRLLAMRVGWVATALGLSVIQVAVLAWRWCFTARRLGVTLSFGEAWREYYLSIFLNQVLPGGVVGDVSRAWRQARGAAGGQDRAGGPAVRAVIFERVSAQAVMTTGAVVSLLALPSVVGQPSGPMVAMTVAMALLIAAATAVWVRRQASAQSVTGRVLAELADSHFSPSVFAVQLATGLFIVGTYLATYIVSARAVGIETPSLVLLPLVAPVLMTMVIPVTIAGWGLRESAAALLWGAVGLTAADGVTVSVAYGVIVLVGSLPGALVLALARRA